MAEGHGGGGGGSGAGFFLALFACVAVAWFFANVQKQSDRALPGTAAVTDSVLEDEPTGQEVPPASPAAHRDHGITYYLDEDGNILNVVRF